MDVFVSQTSLVLCKVRTTSEEGTPILTVQSKCSRFWRPTFLCALLVHLYSFWVLELTHVTTRVAAHFAMTPPPPCHDGIASAGDTGDTSATHLSTQTIT